MMLTPLHSIFYIFSAIAVGSGIAVITARNPVRSVLSLVVTFFAMAGIWMLLRAEFLSLILLLVYVGAVMTLFLFVVMMLSVEQEKKHSGFVRYLPVGLLIVVLLVGLVMLAFSQALPVATVTPVEVNNTQQLGWLLFTDYAYPFEIAGVLLLAAIVAAIALTHRVPHARRSQRIDEQVRVNPKTRIRL